MSFTITKLKTPLINKMIMLENLEAIILAGGKGERLRPFTENLPKPMVDVVGKPFLCYELEHLKNSGIKKIILCLGYLGNKIEDYFKDGRNFGIEIKYSYENKPLGTGGAIKKAQEMIKGDNFLAMNGDSYFPFKVEEVFISHKKENPLATIVVTRATNPNEQELIETKDNKIKNFLKRGTFQHEKYLSKNPNSYVNAGAYIFNKKILELIPYDSNISLENEIFPKISDEMRVFFHKGYFKDIANIKFLEEFRKDVSNGRIEYGKNI